MSEYQYYEFQAIDRPLDADARAALRGLSSRARITATGFVNSYQWGDFKGDPAALMERWFDLHLYFANWGTRRLMIRLPARLLDSRRLASIIRPIEDVALKTAGERLILDIARNEIETGWEEDGEGRLVALAPLREELLRGDLRLFTLIWLMGVEDESVPETAEEPGPGLGPMTAAQTAFADFFCLDPDLLAAAAERRAAPADDGLAPDRVRAAIAALGEAETTRLLLRVLDGDPHVGPELRRMLRDRVAAPVAPPHPPRTAGALRARAEAIRTAREAAEAERTAAELRRREAAAEQARRARRAALAARGEAVWREVEAEIERRSAAGYEAAAVLLAELRILAAEQGRLPAFAARLAALRDRHARKGRFLERLGAMEGSGTAAADTAPATVPGLLVHAVGVRVGRR